MENNKEITVLDGAGVSKATLKTSISALEAQVIARSENLNEPALCAMFELTHKEVTAILAKK
jgi:hypothetical protein